jgi:hypothetical protein
MPQYLYKKEALCINVSETCCTMVKLAVLLLTVDNIEYIWNISFHVAHFKIKPLMMMSGVDIWHQDEVILIWRNLKHTFKDQDILVLLDARNEGCRTYCSASLQLVEF